jgi:hypothetical protein
MDDVHERGDGLLSAQGDVTEASRRVEEALDLMVLFAEATIDGRLVVRLGFALISTVAPRWSAKMARGRSAS